MLLIKLLDKTDYKSEGKKRIALRKLKRIQKIQDKVQQRENRKQNCCEGNINCNGTTDCMWY